MHPTSSVRGAKAKFRVVNVSKFGTPKPQNPFVCHDMEVSINVGTPTWMVCEGKPLQNLRVPPFLETPIYLVIVFHGHTMDTSPISRHPAMTTAATLQSCNGFFGAGCGSLKMVSVSSTCNTRSAIVLTTQVTIPSAQHEIPH